MLLVRCCRRSRSNRRGVLLNRHSDFEEFAVILGTLLQYRLGDGLCALPLSARIKMNALFAAM